MNRPFPLPAFALLAIASVFCAAAASPTAPPVSSARATAAVADGRECPPSNARLRPGSGAGHERNEPTPAQVAAVEQEISTLAAQKGPSPAPIGRPPTASVPTRVEIPVYVHVLHDEDHGRLSTETIDAQIQVLNRSFGGEYGGRDTGFGFVLKGVTSTDNARWYREPERYEAEFKKRLHKGGPQTLNIYSADLGDKNLGWANAPWEYRSDPEMDGVVVHSGSLPGGALSDFDRGFTASHEVGHWLGLYHTFQDGCGGSGDRVSDTPPERNATEGCPSDKNTCPAAGTDPVHNFMDYSHDACMREFTAKQSERMHKVWTAYRA